MLDIKINLKSNKTPKIRFKGNSNDILNELMQINVYVIDYVLEHTKASIKENLDTIDNYTNFLNDKLKSKYGKDIGNYGNIR